MPYFKKRRLLEGGAYSGLGVNGAAFVKGRRLFETFRLLAEIWQFKKEKYVILLFTRLCKES